MSSSVRSSPPAASLRQAGYRVTPQRQAILRVLETSDRPLNVEEIRSRMEGFRSGVPTIYRNLQQFAEQGWVESIVGADQATRFVLCRTAKHHHHVECERCGRTVEVEGCGFRKPLDGMAARSGFRITRHQLRLFGLCPKCQGRP